MNFPKFFMDFRNLKNEEKLGYWRSTLLFLIYPIFIRKTSIHWNIVLSKLFFHILNGLKFGFLLFSCHDYKILRLYTDSPLRRVSSRSHQSEFYYSDSLAVTLHMRHFYQLKPLSVTSTITLLSIPIPKYASYKAIHRDFFQLTPIKN